MFIITKKRLLKLIDMHLAGPEYLKSITEDKTDYFDGQIDALNRLKREFTHENEKEDM